MTMLSVLIGRPLANSDAETSRIGVLESVPAMGLDGLGSASYGPEAALTVLAPLGLAGIAAIGPLMAAVLLLLVVLFVSYWQTITAYPNSGGSYTVARENLGPGAGLLAASALMVDYMLNVAVGTSAGIGALTSALPGLQPWTLPLCLATLAVITLVNLRDTRESGLLFAVPTYLFIAGLGVVLLAGTWAISGGTPAHPPPPPPLPHRSQPLTLWILLRAFVAGCTAMTGIEAVSNGVGACREPRTRHAHGTLTAIMVVVVLGLLLLGIAHLTRAYGIMAMDQTRPGYQSVVSQLIAAIHGRDWLYDVTIGSVLAGLCLSANTSFVGFPRLCRLVAQDDCLPRAFAVFGRRLVHSAGILFLTGAPRC